MVSLSGKLPLLPSELDARIEEFGREASKALRALLEDLTEGQVDVTI